VETLSSFSKGMGFNTANSTSNFNQIPSASPVLIGALIRIYSQSLLSTTAILPKFSYIQCAITTITSAIHVAFNDGLDERFAVLSSEGRILFYRGTKFMQEIKAGIKARQVFCIRDDVVGVLGIDSEGRDSI
jgi:hypothetical protein